MPKLHILQMTLLAWNSFCVEKVDVSIGHIQFGVDSIKEVIFEYKNQNGNLAL